MRRFLIPVLLALGFGAQAQDLAVYYDALRNDFVPGYSYNGAIDFATTAPTRNGSLASIAFTSSGEGAIAFPNELRDFNTAQYSGVRFYVHGGATGNAGAALGGFDRVRRWTFAVRVALEFRKVVVVLEFVALVASAFDAAFSGLLSAGLGALAHGLGKA